MLLGAMTLINWSYTFVRREWDEETKAKAAICYFYRISRGGISLGKGYFPVQNTRGFAISNQGIKAESKRIYENYRLFLEEIARC